MTSSVLSPHRGTDLEVSSTVADLPGGPAATAHATAVLNCGP